MNKLAHYEHLPVYGVDVFYASDLDALETLIYQYYRKGDIDFVETRVSEDGTGGFSTTICLRDDPTQIVAFIMFINSDEDLNCLSHESAHICSLIFKFIGQKACEENDECQAYLTGYLTGVFAENILSEVKVCQKLKKKKFNRNIGR